MTKERYLETHGLKHGKHEKKLYRVWRVLGPAGPEVEELIYGLQEARDLCIGCWDYEITRVNDGKRMKV